MAELGALLSVLFFALFFAVASGKCGGTYHLKADSDESKTLNVTIQANSSDPLNCYWHVTTDFRSKKNTPIQEFSPKLYFIIKANDFWACDGTVFQVDGKTVYKGANFNGSMAFVSQSHRTVFRLWSEKCRPGQSFELTILPYSGCGGKRIISTETQHLSRTISNPVFPGPTPAALLCKWQIVNHFRRSIHFNLTTDDQGCSNYSIQLIVSGKKQDICIKGWRLSNTYSVAWIAEIVLLGHPIQPFSVQYSDYIGTSYAQIPPPPTTSACKDIILFVQPGGSITFQSPNFPNLYPYQTLCTWTIASIPYSQEDTTMGAALIQNKLDFWAESFNIEDTSSCTDSRLSFANTGSKCGLYPTPRYLLRSERHITDVRFVSKENSRPGFRVRVTSYASKCKSGLYSLLPGKNLSLSSPGYPSSYENSTICQWTISAESGLGNDASRIYILASSYYIESSSDCYKDYLLIDSLQRVCGNRTTPQAWLSNSNRAALKFSSNAAVNADGFQLTLSVVTTCGGTRGFLTSGSIAAPSFPGVYPSAPLKCSWVVRNYNNRGITFVTNATASVCRDYDLFVVDGVTNQRSRLCNKSDLIGEFTVDSPKAVFEFVAIHTPSGSPPSFTTIYSDYTGKPKGTTATKCGKSFQDIKPLATTSITSPNYPEAYPASTQCSWIVTTDSSSRQGLEVFPRSKYSIYVTLSNYSIEYDSSCSRDHLQVGNYPKLCGASSVRSAFVVPNFEGVFKFTSNYAVNKNGFKLDAKAIESCGGVLNITETGKDYVFKGPTFEGPYPQSMVCRWQLNNVLGKPISVRAERSVSSCSGFVINLWDQWNGRTYNMCEGSVSSGRTVITGGSVAVFSLIVDPRPSNDSERPPITFQVVYKDSPPPAGAPSARFPSTCGQEILQMPEDRRMELTSPNYPNNYPDNANCTWTVRTKSSPRNSTLAFPRFNYVLYFNLRAYNIESGSACQKDSLQIGGSSRICGQSSAPRAFVEPSPESQIRFLSDGAGHKDGFLLDIVPVPACGGILYADESWQNIFAPSFPSPYPKVACQWEIVNSAGRFVNFRPMGEWRCQNFVLTITDSYRGEHDFCSVRKFETYAARIVVFFATTLPTDEARRFQLAFFGHPPDRYKHRCGYRDILVDLQSNTSISSPNYPNKFTDSVTCQWNVETTNSSLREGIYVFPRSSYSLYLSVHKFTITDFLYCHVVNFKIDNNPTVCKSFKFKRSYIVPSSKTSIRMATQWNHNKSGFKMEIRPISSCGGVLSITQANKNYVFKGPTFEGPYPQSMVCRWQLNNVLGKPISVRVQRSFSNCSGFVINLWDQWNGRTYNMCEGLASPHKTVITGGSKAVFSLIVDPTGSDDSERPPITFQVVYKDSPPPTVAPTSLPVGCGNATLQVPLNDRKQLTSPNYPNNYPLNTNCTWTVGTKSSPRNFSLVFPRFNYVLYFYVNGFNMENSLWCQKDSLQIGGSSRICGRSSAPRAFVEPSPESQIRFLSDAAGHKPGFLLDIIPIPACGGLLHAYRTYQSLHSPSFPDPYPSAVTCQWEFVNDAGGGLYFQSAAYKWKCENFTFYLREVDTNRTFNLCNHPGFIPGAFFYTLTGSRAVVVFKTTLPSSQLRKFTFTFKSLHPTLIAPSPWCGDTSLHISPLASKSVASKDYPNKYAPQTNCTWTVTTNPSLRQGGQVFPSSRFSLYLILHQFSLNPKSNCSADSLQVDENPKICGSSEVLQAFLVPNFRSVIRFIRNSTNTYKGFKMDIKVIPSCGGVLNITEIGKGYVLNAPTFDGPYPQSVMCRWQLNNVLKRGMSARLERTLNCSGFNLILQGQSEPARSLCESPATMGERMTTNASSAVFTFSVEKRAPSSPPITFRVVIGDIALPTWSSWTAWSACSATCNAGIRRRTRNCAAEGHASSECLKSGKTARDRTDELIEACFLSTCPTSAVQRANAIFINLESTVAIPKKMFFKVVWPILASTLESAINAFCTGKPNKCCDKAPTGIWKPKNPSDVFLSTAHLYASDDSPRAVSRTLQQVSIYVIPPRPNPFCDNLVLQTRKRRKKRAAATDPSPPLPRALLTEATKNIRMDDVTVKINKDLKAAGFNGTIALAHGSPPPPAKSDGKWKIAVGVIFGVLGVVAIAAVVYFVLKKARNDESQGTNLDGINISLNNPVYEKRTNQLFVPTS